MKPLLRARFSVFVFGLALVAPSGVASQTPATSSALLRTGDVLRVTAYGLPDVSGELEVGPDGSLIHPLYRNVGMTGLPRDSVENRVRWILERFETNPRFVIEPLVRFVIGGTVSQPGFHNVQPGTTLRQGVLIAGGALEEDRGDAVTLVRRGASTQFTLTGAGDVVLASGDEVIVPAVKPDGNFFRDVLTPIAALASVVVSIVNIANN